jgi:membrane-bound serine protease (ClpP class)
MARRRGNPGGFGFFVRRRILGLVSWTGRCILLAACLLVPSGASASQIYSMEVRGPIFTPVLRYLEIVLEQAEEAGADAVLLELDTPGGSLNATKDIVQKILGAPIPVIVYVAPSGAGAISAGTFITLAGHVAAMAPGTTIGAAHPVMPLSGGERDEVMEQKAENYAATFIEAIAQQRGRNVEWAAEAVRKSAAITAERALELNVVDLVAPTRERLLEEIDGRTVSVRGEEKPLATASPTFHQVDMTVQQRVYFFLSQPTVLLLLTLGGLAALYIEFNSPGLLLPGTVGAICLLLAAIGFSIVPVNFTGVALIALGVALLVTEIFVPSFGVLGIGGIFCLVAGSLLLFHTVEAPGLVVHQGIIATTAIAFGAFFLTVGALVAKAHTRQVAAGKEAMIGAAGTVRRRLAPQGTVNVWGEIWDATLSEGGELEEGSEIEVVGIEGLRLIVAPRRRS